jgi:hypothetical protein
MGMALKPMRGPVRAALAQPAKKGASTALAATPAPRHNTVRREGWLTLWMLGLDERLLSSMVLKSLDMGLGFQTGFNLIFALCAFEAFFFGTHVAGLHLGFFLSLFGSRCGLLFWRALQAGFHVGPARVASKALGFGICATGFHFFALWGSVGHAGASEGGDEAKGCNSKFHGITFKWGFKGFNTAMDRGTAIHRRTVPQTRSRPELGAPLKV